MLESLLAAIVIIAALAAILWWSNAAKRRLAARLDAAERQINAQEALIERARIRDDIDRATARLDSESLHQQLEGDYRD